MRILGLASDVWISSAALLEDGRVLAASAEERFDRRKMSRGFPRQALEFCLARAACTLADIDVIAFGWNPAVHLRSLSGRYTDVARWRGEYLYMLPGALLSQFDSPAVEGIEQVLDTEAWTARIKYVRHHDAHIASAYFLSPFAEAAVLTVDGRGEEETCTFSVARGNRIERLASVKLPHSLGLFYAALTEYLGFRPDSDEWKVMALASYGHANDNPYVRKLRSLVNLLPDGRFELDLSCFAYYAFDRQPHMFSEKLETLLGPRRRRGEELEQRHSDIAFALQKVFEDTNLHMLDRLQRDTGMANLALAGGAAMNSVFNGRIAHATRFKNVFVPSCPDDSGVSVGAALHSYYVGDDERARCVQTHNFWGPAFDNRAIAATLGRYKIKAVREDDVVARTAALMAEGKLVGWFQGAAEFGQRALGNRSIVADPRDAAAKDRLNAAVKYREAFRPFAPAILAERAHEYFDLPGDVTVPFMEKVVAFRAGRGDQVPAVVHVDGSGRLQTVVEKDNPRFYALIKAFERITSVPIILNTSFNVNGEPIVCTPEDAIRTFYTCGLDALVMGDYLVQK